MHIYIKLKFEKCIVHGKTTHIPIHYLERDQMENVTIVKSTGECSGEAAHSCSLARTFSVRTHRVWQQTLI